MRGLVTREQIQASLLTAELLEARPAETCLPDESIREIGDRFIKSAVPVLVATAWVGASEFIRNQVLFNSYWVDHYAGLGLVFPGKPINGVSWGIWSLLFAGAVYVIARKFTLVQTTLLAWCVGFVLMWIVIGNLGNDPEARCTPTGKWVTHFSLAVNERRRQIGVLRALGASQATVLKSLLAESTLLALAGGLIVALFLYANDVYAEGSQALRYAMFNVVSIASTTGCGTWGPPGPSK